MASQKSFTISVKFRKIDSSIQTTELLNTGPAGVPPTFKVDGQRFQTSMRTIKFHNDIKYYVHITVNPPVQFDWLRIAGSDSPLNACTSGKSGSISPSTLSKPCQKEASSGQYWAEWDTSGLSPTPAGKREAINIALQGPDVSLSKALQCKFYAPHDSHASYGTALDAIVFKCAIDSQGSLVVTDEEFK